MVCEPPPPVLEFVPLAVTVCVCASLDVVSVLPEAEASAQVSALVALPLLFPFVFGTVWVCESLDVVALLPVNVWVWDGICEVVSVTVDAPPVLPAV